MYLFLNLRPTVTMPTVAILSENKYFANRGYYKLLPMQVVHFESGSAPKPINERTGIGASFSQPTKICSVPEEACKTGEKHLCEKLALTSRSWLPSTVSEGFR
jgi:hypothetical protein